MKGRSLQSISAAMLTCLFLLLVTIEAQRPSGNAAPPGALRTAWGDPNLEGLWTD